MRTLRKNQLYMLYVSSLPTRAGSKSAKVLLFDINMNLRIEERPVSIHIDVYKAVCCAGSKSAKPLKYTSFGAACSEVEIDLLTGEKTVLRSDLYFDCGRSLNPAVDIGQVILWFLSSELPQLVHLGDGTPHVFIYTASNHGSFSGLPLRRDGLCFECRPQISAPFSHQHALSWHFQFSTIPACLQTTCHFYITKSSVWSGIGLFAFVSLWM